MKENYKACLLWIMALLFPLSSIAYTGEVIKKFSAPGAFPTGMTFDGKNLWIADREEGKIFYVDMQNGKVISEIQSPAYWPTGLTWDGENLWAADIKGGLPLSENYNGKIYQIDPVTGYVLKMIDAPSSRPRGLAWDGQYLWCTDNGSDEIIQFSPDDGTTIRSFKSPASDPRGLTYDGRYLWVSDRLKDEIYMVDPETGIVLIVTDAPGPYAMGLCFDGEAIWAADTEMDEIYRLKIRDGEKFRRTDERKAEITYTHKITNFGPGKVLTSDIYIAIPRPRDNQEIEKVKYITDYDEFVEDESGQITTFYHFTNIPAGESRLARMQTTAKIYAVRYYIYPDQVGTLENIPQDIKNVFLTDNEKYQLEHPVIRKALKEAVGDEKNPYWIARNIYQYLMGKMYYEMLGGWNTAPTVLERGNGSCSEYSFVYISMCRAAGLPARYVGSVVVRGDDASFDDVFHRWVEVYIPNYGWIPVDPSGGDRDWPRDQANYFGHLANRFLITTENAGGSETMGWTYNSNAFYTSEPKTFAVSDHYADWNPLK
ncbi:MAG: transglutaminase domain-containing protein [Bacteroidota bacterium]|nr:transglutaminase domain-containing protein [Bacteroidota bacterium]